MTDRQEVASRIMSLFETLPEVAAVYPRGSLAAGSMDEYSDIDIGIDVSGHDNGEFAKSIDRRMRQQFDLHFSDWATSLMPGSYVQTFFIKGLPVFWNVDIEVTAKPHHPTLSSANIVRDPIAGFLKVWVLNTKYLLRQKPGINQQIAACYGRVFQQPPPQASPPESLLGAILDELEHRANGQLSEFIQNCRDVWNHRLNGNSLAARASSPSTDCRAPMAD